MKKISLGWTLLVAGISFLIGAALMQAWNMYRAREDKALLDTLAQPDSVWLLDMENASTPAGVTAVQEPCAPRALTMPSQLSKIDLPEVQALISRSGAEITPNDGGKNKEGEKDSAPVILLEDTAVVGGVPAGTAAVSAPQEESKITLIEAPVEAQQITSLNEYRAFKRQARGNYPEVDFAKQNSFSMSDGSPFPILFGKIFLMR